MRTFDCCCGNSLFFQSTYCVSCKRATGLCPACQQVVPLIDKADGILCCGNQACGVHVAKCFNGENNDFCNRLVLSNTSEPGLLCDYCCLTSVIPDMPVEGNYEKWMRLEQAKQRVLYMLDQIGLEFRSLDNTSEPKLSFEFKADGEKPVSTGHKNGCITINVREADSVERERSRVELREPQRSLVGHFRHELGHFFWERLVKGKLETPFRALFGDKRTPNYQEALTNYYQTGPAMNWSDNYISAYATMHPWEDFAETFSAYLDMVSVVDTANHFGVTGGDLLDFNSMLKSYSRVGLIANELNRDMGLLDLVPQVFVAPVVEKLRFVHQLRGDSKR